MTHPAERHPRFPSVFEAFFLVVFLFAAEALVSATLRDLRSLAGIAPRDIRGLVALFGNGIFFCVLLHYKGMSYAELFHPTRTSVAAIFGVLTVPVLLMVPALVLGVTGVVSILERIFPLRSWQEAMAEQMLSNEWMTLATVCLLAPFLEEMLFRGIILRSFLKQYSRGRAFLYSATLFGLAHLNVYQFAVGLCIGLVLAWLYERTRSLWPCILLHGAYNSLITWSWYADPGRPSVMPQIPVPYWIAALLLAFTGFTILQRLLKATAQNHG